MSKRRSIEVEGFGHGDTPIPAASRIGNMIASGGIAGVDLVTGKIGGDLEVQVAAKPFGSRSKPRPIRVAT